MATLHQLMETILSVIVILMARYVSAYGFHSHGGYGYAAGMLLKSQLISFNASVYLVNEGDGHVDIYIERSYNIEENITVFTTCEHRVMKTEATGNQ